MLDITKSLIYIDGKERTRELDRKAETQLQNADKDRSYKRGIRIR